MDGREAGRVYTLPMFLAQWPWTPRQNAALQDAKTASNEWIYKSNVLSDKAWARFIKCDYALLAAMVYPSATPDQLRVSCDLMNLLFVLDDLTDVAGAEHARQMVHAVMEGMYNPEVPQKNRLGELSRQFWQRTTQVSSSSTQRRLLEKMRDYTDSVLKEWEDRETTYVRDFSDYLVLRRKTGATEPSFALLQLGLMLPPSMFEDPTILQLERHANDLIVLANDVYSYNVEQARGDGFHNVVTVVEEKFGLTLERALEWVVEYHNIVAESFLALYDDIPSFGREYDKEVKYYVDGLANWVLGNDMWSFKSHRYFGPDGLSIKMHRRVVMLPRKTGVGSN